MADSGFAAYLYPAIGTDGHDAAVYVIAASANKERYVPPRRERPPLVMVEPQPSDSPDDRAASQEPDEHDSLAYTACLKISLDQVPRTSDGVKCGTSPDCDIIFPTLKGLSESRLSFTFNDAYQFIVRDLDSTSGVHIKYGDRDGGKGRNTEWIIGGDEELKDGAPIRIKIIRLLQFVVIVKPYDTNSEVFRAKVRKFREGTAGVDDVFGGLGIRAPTQPATATGTPFGEEFLLKRKIDKGGFAIVYRVWNTRTAEVYALKEPLGDLTPYHADLWETEIRLNRRVSHDHIVKFLGSDSRPRPLLRFEYLCGGSLAQQLKAKKYFTNLECVLITRQISSALGYLHNLRPAITHRDISDNNILINIRDKDRILVKLGDLGISKEGEELKTHVGTPSFLPPEFFVGQSKKYTNAVDVWSLGAVLAKLLAGHPAYTTEHHNDGWSWCKDVRCRLQEHLERNPNELVRLLLDKVLRMNPAERVDAGELHRSSLLLPEGNEDTWKTKRAKKEKLKQRQRQQEEEQEEQEEDDGSEGTTIRLPGRPYNVKVPGVIIDRATDPGLTDDTESGRDSNHGSGTETPRVFERSGAPSLSTITNLEFREAVAAICDPGNSLFDRSDLGADSEFSDVDDDVLQSNPEPKASPQLTAGSVRQHGVVSLAVSVHLHPKMPLKRTREIEEAVLKLKNFQHDSLS